MFEQVWMPDKIKNIARMKGILRFYFPFYLLREESKTTLFQKDINHSFNFMLFNTSTLRKYFLESSFPVLYYRCADVFSDFSKKVPHDVNCKSIFEGIYHFNTVREKKLDFCVHVIGKFVPPLPLYKKPTWFAIFLYMCIVLRCAALPGT